MTFAEFLRDDTSAISFRSLKTRVDGPTPEHIWVDGASFDGRVFRGTLNEDAVFGAAKAGDSVVVAPSEISDWMVVVNGELCGGYTLRGARSLAEDLTAFDAGLATLGLSAWRIARGC
ncbi:MAG: DUF2314 domain-containing protein [Gemmatimonadetes bacterium]|nr:DUF2314 domain-containing protein [Gemmatimonadota bacterium]